MKKAKIRTVSGKMVEIKVEHECTVYIGNYAHKFILEESKMLRRIITHFDTGSGFAHLDLGKSKYGVNVVQAMKDRIQQIVEKHGKERVLDTIKQAMTIK